MTMQVVDAGDYIDCVPCSFCGGIIDYPEKVIQVGDRAGIDYVRLHRNCVVAFATRILNEFEKL